MEKIGHKMLAFILALCLIIPTSSVFAIDGEGIEEVEQPQIEEIKEEAPAEEPKEEVKEEVKEEPQEVKEEIKEEVKEEIKEEVKEEIKKEPQEKIEDINKEIKKENKIIISKNNFTNEQSQNQESEQVDYPIKITWHLKYRNDSGEWTNITLDSRTTDTIKNKTKDSVAPYTTINNQIIKNDLINNSEQKIYNFKNSYTDNNGNSYTTVTLRKLIIAGTDYNGSKDITYKVSKNTDIYLTADYNEYNLIEPYEITYNAFYRSESPILDKDGDGWVCGKTLKVQVNNKGRIITGSEQTPGLTIAKAYEQMKGNFAHNRDIAYNNTYYHFNDLWKDETGNFYTSESIFKAEEHSEDTIINIYAQYSAKPIYGVTINYIDNIGNGGGKWSNISEENAAVSSYSSANGKANRLAEPPDIPPNYIFKYWKSDWVQNDKVIYYADEVFNLNILEQIKSETIINFIACYDYIEPVPEPEPAPTPDPTPEVKPTPEPTPEPTPVSPTEPTKPKKDNTVVKKQTTTTITTETYTETRVISPLPTPKAAEPTIEESKIPLARPQGMWALLNLILTIISCLIAIILLFIKKKSENDEYTDEEEKDIHSMRRFKIFSILFGIVSIIVFIFTEDMTMPMVWIDKWTILMAIFTGIEIANIFIIRQKAQEEEIEEEE